MRTASYLTNLVAAIGISIGGIPAYAQVDARIRTIAYHSDVITTLTTRPNYETMIAFAPDERIENIALGDSASWQVTPNKSARMVFVKPVAYGLRTNMAVVTDKRSYLFELRSDRGRTTALFSVRFQYPQPPVVARPYVPIIMLPPPPSPVLTSWQAGGNIALRPSRIYDDGKSVYVAWPTDRPLPVLLARAPDGTDEPASFTIRGNYLVIDEIPSRLLVRVGRSQAVLTPPHAAGRAPSNQIAGS